jgi:SOS-response transcriptional repressor LexA
MSPIVEEIIQEGRANMATRLGKNTSEIPLYTMQLESEIMKDAGLHKGDVLIVDRNAEAIHGSIIIADLSGDLRVRKLLIENGRKFLVAPGTATAPIELMEIYACWGVVISLVRNIC